MDLVARRRADRLRRARRDRADRACRAAAPSSSPRCRRASAYDGSDDLLNPTRGYRLSGRLSPEASLQNGAFGYARAQIDGSAYLPVTRLHQPRRAHPARHDRRREPRSASRRRGASIRAAADRCAAMAIRRSARAMSNNDPVGGRSLAEFAIEARVRFGDFGVVPFLDGGNLYTAGAAALHRPALRRRASARAIIPASARSASMSARRSTAARAMRGSRSTSRWARPSDGGGRRRRSPARRAAAPAAGGRCAGSAGCCWRSLALIGAGAGGDRYRSGPPLPRRSDRRAAPIKRACASASAGSTDRSGARRGCATCASTIRRACSSKCPSSTLDWRPTALAGQPARHRSAGDRPRHPAPPAQAAADRHARADPARLRHPHRPLSSRARCGSSRR